MASFVGSIHVSLLRCYYLRLLLSCARLLPLSTSAIRSRICVNMIIFSDSFFFVFDLLAYTTRRHHKASPTPGYGHSLRYTYMYTHTIEICFATWLFHTLCYAFRVCVSSSALRRNVIETRFFTQTIPTSPSTKQQPSSNGFYVWVVRFVCSERTEEGSHSY